MNIDSVEKTSRDIVEVFNLQKSNKWKVSRAQSEERKIKLRKLRNSIENHTNEIKEALHKDLRKNAMSVEASELANCYKEIDDALKNLDVWMEPVEVDVSPEFEGSQAKVVYEPKGIVLLFGPWNFPFSLVFQPLIQIISAGNCAMVKPNEMAPHTSYITAKIINEVFEPCEIAVFEGGIELAEELLRLPVDHIFFTGSPSVGKLVMSSAAKHLSTVTLELGGKNPVIIDQDVNIQSVAKKVAYARNINSGQVCLCPENVFVHKDQEEEFITAVKSVYHSAFYVDGKLNQDVLGKIVDRKNLDRIVDYLQDALKKGAVCHVGGTVIVESLGVHPTILTNVSSEAKILKEEVFGPVLCIFSYENVDDVYAILNEQPKPLALYIFSKDERFVDEVLANTSSGGVTVNNCIQHCMEHSLPFGGVNNSGIGRYHGVHGFKELSHERAVLKMI